MIYLRQSTASQEVILGPFVDSTDGNTQKTALTIANTDIKIWVTGATTLANKNSGGATHISGGIYYAVLDATDTATIGPLVIFVHVATALAVRVACMVLDEAVYDAWFGTVALATATNITAGTITTVTTLTNDPTGVGTLLTRMGTPANLGSGATVAANLNDIEGFVDDIPTLQTSVDDLPTNAELATALGAADDAVLAAIAALNNLSQANIRTAVGLASANLDTQLADLPTNSELAAALATADDATLAAIAALNNLSQANVRAAVGLASANLDTQLDALPTNAELAAALATADDAVLAAIAALNNLSQANIRTALGMASANLDTQLADLPTNAELATALGTADDAVLAAIAALNNLSAAQVGTEVDTALDTTIADSVPADGTRPSVRQALYMVTQFLMEKEVAGTTVTVNKPDATTALMTFTLDDAANPTTITRTT
jgi:hypothetical protein